MKRTLVAFALLAGAAAFAGDYSQKKPDDKTDESSQMKKETMAKPQDYRGHEKSEQSARGPLAPEGNEISGEVCKFDGKTLYLKHMGAVVAFKVDKKTSMVDVKKGDLVEGKQVRASFSVQGKTTNVLTSLSFASEGDSAVGGSGESGTPAIPESSEDSWNQPAEPEREPGLPSPEDPGTPQRNAPPPVY